MHIFSFLTLVFQALSNRAFLTAQNNNYSLNPNYLFFPAVLLLAGFAFLSLPAAASAQSSSSMESANKNFDIAAGSLENALKQFSDQSGVKIFFDPAIVAGLSTQGLVGNYDIQTGLDRLLTGSGLRSASQADGFTLVKSASRPANEPVAVHAQRSKRSKEPQREKTKCSQPSQIQI